MLLKSRVTPKDNAPVSVRVNYGGTSVESHTTCGEVADRSTLIIGDKQRIWATAGHESTLHA